MEKSEIFKILSLIKDKLDKRSKVKALPDEGIITIRRKTGTRLFVSVFFSLFVSLFVLGAILSDGFIVIGFVVVSAAFIYQIFNINRTVQIDFDKQLFTIKYFAFSASEHSFSDFKNIINTIQKVNGRYTGITLSIEFNNASYVVGHFQNQDEINAMNVIFNLVKNYELSHKQERENPFIEKMTQMSDEKLLNAIQNRDDYTEEAKKAMKKVGIERNLIDKNWKIIEHIIPAETNEKSK